jgi:hypothetical protein
MKWEGQVTLWQHNTPRGGWHGWDDIEWSWLIDEAKMRAILDPLILFRL